jgi:hypothetical protein
VGTNPLIAVPTTSLSTPLADAEFGLVSPTKKVRGTPQLGSGVVEELRRVYEERCRIVKTQEPGRGRGGLKDASRGGLGIGVGKG